MRGWKILLASVMVSWPIYGGKKQDLTWLSANGGDAVETLDYVFDMWGHLTPNMFYGSALLPSPNTHPWSINAHVEERHTGLVCVLMAYFSHRTLERLRQIGDSLLNHENTPTGDRGSTNMDTVWEERSRVENQGMYCELLQYRWSNQADCNMLKACCSATWATLFPPCKHLIRFTLTQTCRTLDSIFNAC